LGLFAGQQTAALEVASSTMDVNYSHSKPIDSKKATASGKVLEDTSDSLVRLLARITLPSLSQTVQSASSPVFVTMPVHLRQSSFLLQLINTVPKINKINIVLFMINNFSKDTL